MANVIGNLRAILSLNTKSFIAGLTTAGRATRQFRGTMFDVGRGVSRLGSFIGGFVAPGAALYSMISGFRELGDLADLGERLNIGNKALQGFRLAAMDAGLSADDTTTALQFMLKTVGEATTGSKEAAKAIAGLGISIDGLAQQSSDEILYRVADALQKIKDPAIRAAREVDIFGRAGAKLDAALKGGRGNLKGFEAEMQKMGRVFDKESLEKVDKAGDAFNRLKESLKGLRDVSIVGFGPALEATAKGLSSAVSEVTGQASGANKKVAPLIIHGPGNIGPKPSAQELKDQAAFDANPHNKNTVADKEKAAADKAAEKEKQRLLGMKRSGRILPNERDDWQKREYIRNLKRQGFLITDEEKQFIAPKPKDGQSSLDVKLLDRIASTLDRIEKKNAGMVA